MKSAINITSADWWLCLFILFAMAAALAGFNEGYYATIAISIVRITISSYSTGITSEATVNRFVYGFLIAVAFYMSDNINHAWWLMFIATAIYTFIDKHLVERLLVWLE